MRDIKLISFVDAIQLVGVLPGKVADDMRSDSAKLITRYLAGDKTLVRELNQNSQSTAPITKMAQEALGISAEDNKVQTVASDDIIKFAINKFNEASKSNLDVVKTIADAKDNHINDLKESNVEIVKAKDEVVKAKDSVIEAKDEIIRVQQDSMNLMKSLLGK